MTGHPQSQPSTTCRHGISQDCPACAEETIASLRAKVDELTAALREISTHWANQYDHPRKENEMYRGSYGIGVTDGHRACKIIADKALALNSQDQ